MADTLDPANNAAAATVAAPAAAPAAATPVADAIQPASATPAPAPSDSSAAAPVPPTAPEPAKPELAPATSLLSDTPKPAEPSADAKPEGGDVKPDEGQKPADPAAQAEPEKPAEPALLPTYEFKLPEGVEADPEQIGRLNELIGTFEQTAGVDHAKAQEFGQKALEYHVAELQRVTTELDRQQREAWTVMRDEWKNSFKSDPEIGGNRQQTTLARCTAIIDQFGGNEQQRAELRNILGVTGAGDHPAIIRLLANVGKALGEGRPVPAVVPKSPVVPSRKERRYHSNGAA